MSNDGIQKNTDLQIEQVEISKLRAAEYNPRKISDAEFKQLVQSIKVHGMVEPLLANSNPARANILIAGHQRLRALKQLDYKIVPVIFFDLNEEYERKLNLRMNRIGGEFDVELLRNYDIPTLLETGFDDSNLADIWNDALDTEDDGFDEEKAVKAAAQTNIKPGDLFALGRHRLLCGDSTDPAVIKRLVGDVTPGMLYCDPIYNIGLNYDKGISLKKGGYGGTTNDRKSDAAYKEFLKTALSNALAVMPEDAHAFVYCDQLYIGMLQLLMVELGLSNKRVCLWVKNNFNMTPQVAFNKAYEPCVYGARGKPFLSADHNLTEILNKEIAVGNRAIDDIVDLFDIWLAKRDPALNYQHPTQKPVTLHEKPLKRCTRPGDAVLDIFAGSGSLLAACEQLKRTALLCEIEPVFCQVIVDRYEALTGEKAVKL